MQRWSWWNGSSVPLSWHHHSAMSWLTNSQGPEPNNENLNNTLQLEQPSSNVLLETHVSNYHSGLPIDLRTYTCTDTARVPYIPVHCHYVIDTLSPTFAKGLLRAGCSLSLPSPLLVCCPQVAVCGSPTWFLISRVQNGRQNGKGGWWRQRSCSRAHDLVNSWRLHSELPRFNNRLLITQHTQWRTQVSTQREGQELRASVKDKDGLCVCEHRARLKRRWDRGWHVHGCECASLCARAL